MIKDLTKLRIRKAQETEADEIKRLASEVVIHNYSPFLGVQTTKTYVDNGASDGEIDNNIHDMYVGLYDNEIVSIAVLHDDLLHMLMVKYRYQKRGFGGTMLSFAEKKMFEYYDVISLETFEDNAPTIAFYEKHGWKITGKASIDPTGGFMLKFEKHRA